jgi:hypothetical protein
MVLSITKEEDVKILVKQDIDPTDLSNAITLADKQLVSLLGIPLDDVQTNDAVYGALESIGATYAAWQILIGWDKDEYLDKAKLMWQNYLTQLDNFRKMPLPNSLANTNIVMAESDYMIPSLNPDIPHFLSDY